MSQISVGKLLPNIKISVGNEDADSNRSTLDKWIDDDEATKDSNIEVFCKSLQSPKVYLNKTGGFTTGIDLLSKNNAEILNKRALRFGLEKEEDFIKPSINSLYESLGINIENKQSAFMKKIRLDTLHMRGVEKMHTQNVFDYFENYGPAGIEWINDHCCNVMWNDEITCARALLGLSKPLGALKKEYFDIMNASDDEFSETTTEHLENAAECPDVEQLDITNLDISKIEEDMDVDNPENKCSQPKPLGIPAPRGRWRLGVTLANAGIVLLRFATTDDKKLPGAEKRSNYYKMYGNPNYGGLKGLISSSRKSRSLAASNRRAVESATYSKKKETSASLDSESDVPAKKVKVIRMRMYADDEEEKKAKRAKLDFASHNQSKRSVYSRLGSKYTQDDLYHLGKHKNFDDNYGSYSNFDSSSSGVDDLRSKLIRLRSKESSVMPRNVSYFKNAGKEKGKDYFKRKHRSPLCIDEDDDFESSCSND